MKRVVATGAMNNLALAALSSSLQYLQALIAMRILGPEQIGLFAMAAAIAVTLEWVSDFGIGDQLIQESDADFQAKFDTAATVYLILAVVLAGVTIALAPLMARLYRQPALSALVMGISYAAFTGFLRLPLSLLVRDLKYVQQRLLGLAGRFVSLVVTIGLALHGVGAWCLVAGGFAGLLTTGISAWALCSMRPRWRISLPLLKPLFQFSSPVWASKIAYVLVQQGSILVLSGFLTIEDVGRYKASEQVANIIYYVETVLAQTMFPVFCRLRDSDHLLRAAFSKASRISMFWIAAASVGVALFAPDVVRYVLTERWRGAEFFLRAQGIALLFGAVLNGWDSVLKARNRTQVLLLMSGFFGICFVVIFVPAVVFAGRAGVAGAIIAIAAVILLARVVVLRKLGLGVSMLEIGGRAWAAAAVAVAAVFAVASLPHTPSLAFTAIKVLVYAVVYAGVLGFLEFNLLREIVSLVLPRPDKEVAQAAEVA